MLNAHVHLLRCRMRPTLPRFDKGEINGYESDCDYRSHYRHRRGCNLVFRRGPRLHAHRCAATACKHTSHHSGASNTGNALEPHGFRARDLDRSVPRRLERHLCSVRACDRFGTSLAAQGSGRSRAKRRKTSAGACGRSRTLPVDPAVPGKQPVHPISGHQ